jgi:hypothetical protein
MDFYTLNTTVDLNDPVNIGHLVRSIGFFTQPSLLGTPKQDAQGEFLRFAVRPDTLVWKQDDFLDLLCFNTPFTRENTTLVRSDDI